MNKPKVSIVVPVYNVEKYLPCCMDSLLNQTLKDIEIILVDDGSPDNCHALCDEYAKQDHRVRVIHKKNEGLGYARNSGIEISTGEYIVFVDSDDYVELHTYQKLYDLATNTKADVIYFAFQRFDNQSNLWEEPSFSKEIRHHTNEDVRELILNIVGNPPAAKYDTNIQCSACCSLYKHELIKQHKLKFKSERELISEDLVFNIEYLVRSSNVVTIPDAFYYYRFNLSSLTHTVRPDRIEKNYFFYQYILDKLTAHNFGKDGYLRATRQFIGYSRHSIRQYLQSSLPKQEKMQWLKEVANHHIWREIAFSYPYRQLPVKQALQFYLLQKGYCHLLYYLVVVKQLFSKDL